MKIDELMDTLNSNVEAKQELSDMFNSLLEEHGDKLETAGILNYKLVEKLKEEINNPDENNLGVILFLIYECLFDVNYENNPSANILIETALKFGNITLMKYKSELDNFELKSKNEGTILWDNNIRSILDVIKNNLSDEMNTEIKNFIDNQDQELFTQTVFGNSYDFFKAFIEGKPQNHAQEESESLTELLAEGEGKIYKVTVFDSDNNILKKHRMNKYGQMIGGSKELLNVEEYAIKKIKTDVNYKNNNIYGINKYFGWTVNKEGKRIDNDGKIIYLKK